MKNIWIKTGLIVSALQLDLITATLTDLGKTHGFVLIDWNSLELIDLANKDQTLDYLMHFWK